MLSGLRSLPERARIAEVAKDTEANASKRLYVLPEGLPRRHRRFLHDVALSVLDVTLSGLDVTMSVLNVSVLDMILSVLDMNAA